MIIYGGNTDVIMISKIHTVQIESLLLKGIHLAGRELICTGIKIKISPQNSRLSPYISKSIILPDLREYFHALYLKYTRKSHGTWLRCEVRY